MGRGPKQSGCALLKGRGGCPGCFPIGWLVMTQSRTKIKVRNAAATGVSGLSGVTARRAGFKVGILDDVEFKSLRLGGAEIQQGKSVLAAERKTSQKERLIYHQEVSENFNH